MEHKPWVRVGPALPPITPCLLPHLLCLPWHFSATAVSRLRSLNEQKMSQKRGNCHQTQPREQSWAPQGSRATRLHKQAAAAAELQKMPPAPARILQPGPSPSPTRNNPVLSVQGAELGLNRAARAGPKEPTRKIHLL